MAAQARSQGEAPVGQRMVELVERLYPICRSLTGDGVRETLRIISEIAPLEIREIRTGTPVLEYPGRIRD
jgi:aminopeptidase-like protein